MAAGIRIGERRKRHAALRFGINFSHRTAKLPHQRRTHTDPSAEGPLEAEVSAAHLISFIILLRGRSLLVCGSDEDSSWSDTENKRVQLMTDVTFAVVIVIKGKADGFKVRLHRG
jgi:hypothetical protein